MLENKRDLEIMKGTGSEGSRVRWVLEHICKHSKFLLVPIQIQTAVAE